MRIHTNSSELDGRVSELRKLKEVFDQRIDHWTKNPHEDEEQQLLMGAVRSDANAFFERALGSYVQALRNSDATSIEQEFAALDQIGVDGRNVDVQLCGEEPADLLDHPVVRAHRLCVCMPASGDGADASRRAKSCRNSGRSILPLTFFGNASRTIQRDGSM